MAGSGGSCGMPARKLASRRLPSLSNAPIEASLSSRGALRLSVRTTAFHVVKTGSTPVGRAILIFINNFNGVEGLGIPIVSQNASPKSGSRLAFILGFDAHEFHRLPKFLEA